MENTTSIPPISAGAVSTPIDSPPPVESPVPPISPVPDSAPVFESPSAPEISSPVSAGAGSPNLSDQLSPDQKKVSPTPDPVESKPAPQKISFSQKLKLIRKKFEYINSQKMEPVAAEELARKDLNLPEMSDSEKAKAGRKNIFEKILTLVGFDKKPVEKVAPTVEQNPASTDSNQNPPEQI